MQNKAYVSILSSTHLTGTSSVKSRRCSSMPHKDQRSQNLYLLWTSMHFNRSSRNYHTLWAINYRMWWYEPSLLQILQTRHLVAKAGKHPNATLKSNEKGLCPAYLYLLTLHRLFWRDSCGSFPPSPSPLPQHTQQNWDLFQKDNFWAVFRR